MDSLNNFKITIFTATMTNSVDLKKIKPDEIFEYRPVLFLIFQHIYLLDQYKLIEHLILFGCSRISLCQH